MASSSIVSTSIKVALDPASALLGLKTVSKGVDSLTAKLDKGLIGNLKTLPIVGGIVTLGDSLKKLSFGIFDKFVEATNDLADKNRLAKALGVDVEQFQALAYAARLSGVDLDTLAGGLKFFSKNLQDAATGGNDPFKKLGLSAKELAGLSINEAFVKTAGGIAQLKGAADKTAAALDIFGRAGAALNPLLLKGADGITVLQNEARKIGAVISAEDVARVGQARLAVKGLKESADAFYVQFAVSFAPFVQGLAESLPNVFKQLLDIMPQVKDAILQVTLSLLDAAIASAKFLDTLPKASTFSAKNIGDNAALAAISLPVAIYTWTQQADEANSKNQDLIASIQAVRDKIANFKVTPADAKPAVDLTLALAQAVGTLGGKLKETGDNFGLTNIQIEIAKLKMQGASEESIKFLQSLDKVNTQLSLAASLKVANPLEDYKNQLAALNTALRLGKITNDDYYKSVGNITKKLTEAHNATFSLPSLATAGSAEASNILLSIHERETNPIVSIKEALDLQAKNEAQLIQNGRDAIDVLNEIKDKIVPDEEI